MVDKVETCLPSISIDRREPQTENLTEDGRREMEEKLYPKEGLEYLARTAGAKGRLNGLGTLRGRREPQTEKPTEDGRREMEEKLYPKEGLEYLARTAGAKGRLNGLGTLRGRREPQ